MDFQHSTKPEDLIEGFAAQKPRAAGADQRGRFERTLSFIDADDAEHAKASLVALMPESHHADIKLETAIGIENGTRTYRLTIASTLLPTLRKAMRQQAQGRDEATANAGGFVAQLDARSRGGETRKMPYDLEHPETSLNTFMGKLGVLEHAFDLCERLDYARERHSGNKHKYFASSGSYGLRFDSQADADNAKAIFGAFIGDGAAIKVDVQVISHKSYFWLKVPGDLATSILSEANALARMGAHIATEFKAGHIDQATTERDALLAIVEEMGLGDAQLAEQMTRDAFSGANSRVR